MHIYILIWKICCLKYLKLVCLLVCLILLDVMCKMRITEAFKSVPSSPRMLFSCSFFGQISHVKNTPGQPRLFSSLLLRENLCLATTILSHRFSLLSHSHHFSLKFFFPSFLSLTSFFLFSQL